MYYRKVEEKKEKKVKDKERLLLVDLSYKNC